LIGSAILASLPILDVFADIDPLERLLEDFVTLRKISL
jgi:hypothetical protein